jgi:hypothetical protein
MARAKTDRRTATALDHALRTRTQPVSVTGDRIAGRAYQRYLARRGKQGQNADDMALDDNLGAITKTIEDAVRRLRAEYLEMPGLRLKREQVERLCGIERTLSESVLDSLVDERFLCRKPGGQYARPTEGAIPRPRAAKAELRLEQLAAKAS